MHTAHADAPAMIADAAAAAAEPVVKIASVGTNLTEQTLAQHSGTVTKKKGKKKNALKISNRAGPLPP